MPHLSLILQLTKRDILSRYRGSFLGLVWSFLNPLLLLAIYGFVFTVVFKAKWGGVESGGIEQESTGSFAVIMFSGLIIHMFFAECLTRNPGIIIQNSNFVKRIVFPLHILPVTVVLSALFHYIIALLILFVGVLFFLGNIYFTALLLPLVLLPFILLMAGVSWILSALGVFLRDIAQFMGLIATAALFISPIFYPVEAVPESLRDVIYLNPLTFIVTNTRKILLFGELPDFAGLFIYTAVSLVVFTIGYFWFRKTEKGFSDVI